MKCFLHIGTEKTGTTTLQNFFALNRQTLIDKGYYYPSSLGHVNHLRMAVSAYNPDNRDDLTHKYQLHSNAALLQFQQQVVDELAAELAVLPPTTQIICSNEHLQSRLVTEAELRRLQHNLSTVGITEIEIVVYLRKPADIANSLFSTAMKCGHTFDDVPGPTHPYYENLCNHQKTLQRFAKVFGDNHLHVRLFNKDKLVKHSLVHDMADLIGLDVSTQEWHFPGNKNESLSATGIQILHHLNCAIPIRSDVADNCRRDELVAIISEHLCKPKFVMSAATYQAYDEHFAASNQWVHDNYFNDQQSLFPSSHPPAEQAKLSTEESARLYALISAIWQQNNRAIENKWYRFGKLGARQKLAFLLRLMVAKVFP